MNQTQARISILSPLLAQHYSIFLFSSALIDNTVVILLAVVFDLLLQFWHVFSFIGMLQYDDNLNSKLLNRIERLWRDVFRVVTCLFYNVLH